MANRTGRGQFKKGQSGNPGGKKPDDPEIKAFKETTYKDFIDHLQKFGAYTSSQMDIELKRPSATMFEIMFCNIISSASKGDKDARQLLLDRLWGKVKNAIDVTHEVSQLAGLSNDEIIAKAQQAIKVLEENKVK